MPRILIVGGVAGGASAAARLRRLDENADIIIFERGEHVSYANCGLPYYVGGVIKDRDRLFVQTPENLKKLLNIDVRIKHEVLSIDRQQKTVKVKNLSTAEVRDERYDTLVLSPGADAITPSIAGLADVPYFTIRNVKDTDAMVDFIVANNPQRAIVIGGGFIGIELAENLVHRGLEVTVVEMQPQILTMLDTEMVALVYEHLRSKGISLHLGTKAFQTSSEASIFVLKLDDGTELPFDMLALAAGVKPNSELALTAGLELSARGAIMVNDQMQTSDPCIYAVGDAIEIKERVSGKPCHLPLAGPANKQGRLVADIIAGRNTAYSGALGTSILKIFDFTVAATGLREEHLRTLGVEAKSVIIHPQSHAGYYPGAVPMTLKLIYDLNGKILGAQAVGGEGVDKRIDVIATSIHFGGSVKDLQELDLAYAPPYSSAKDPVNIAGYAAGNILNGDVNSVSAQEYLSNVERFTLLDVREPIERSFSPMTDAIEIPLGELRAKTESLPKGKPLLVCCQVGMRSYIAARLLSQLGYQAYTLSGGLKIVRALMNDQTIPSRNEKATAGEGVKSMKVQTTVYVDACGLQCPGPIMQIYQRMQKMSEGEVMEVQATDPAFPTDVESWCRVTGNTLIQKSTAAGVYTALVRKGSAQVKGAATPSQYDDKTMVVFSGDLDKAIASFIIANGAASMGKKVTMFFTFWGLNVLRKHEGAQVKKGLLDHMFSMMMPKGSRRLGLSKMNMLGMGPLMIRFVMKQKNVDPLEQLIEQAKQVGIRIVACQMSLDIMGLKKEELIDGIEIGGVASYLDAAERANVNLFI
ncbi:MAG: DsrE/DsrF/DrsH-like family protein [Peptococcaceae bacterium]|nr:DsrE/DsrF/DrsH-like family protein [Peptococcaceae bacterium]